MSDQMQTGSEPTAPDPAVAAEALAAATADPTPDVSDAEAEKFELGDVERCYFGPDDLQNAKEYLDKITAISPEVSIQKNFKPEEAWEDGFGLAVVPISKRVAERGNVTIGVAVAAMPDPATVAAHPKGIDFINSLITDVQMAKVANSVRPRSDGTAAGTMPRSIEDFIESRRGRESLKTFSEIAPAFVKALRKKGLKFMTTTILRQILQSTAFADELPIPHKEGLWEAVGNKMISVAKDKGLDPAVLVNWLENRDQATMAEVEELELADIDALV